MYLELYKMETTQAIETNYKKRWRPLVLVRSILLGFFLLAPSSCSSEERWSSPPTLNTEHASVLGISHLHATREALTGTSVEHGRVIGIEELKDLGVPESEIESAANRVVRIIAKIQDPDSEEVSGSIFSGIVLESTKNKLVVATSLHSFTNGSTDLTKNLFRYISEIVIKSRDDRTLYPPFQLSIQPTAINIDGIDTTSDLVILTITPLEGEDFDFIELERSTIFDSSSAVFGTPIIILSYPSSFQTQRKPVLVATHGTFAGFNKDYFRQGIVEGSNNAPGSSGGGAFVFVGDKLIPIGVLSAVTNLNNKPITFFVPLPLIEQ